MTINFNGGIHEVILFKDGKRYDRTNLPVFFNSIESVVVKFGNELLGSIDVHLTPSFQDAIAILQSGLLGIGLGDSGQMPVTSEASQSGKSVSAKAIGDTVSSPKAAAASGPDIASSVEPILAVRFLYPNQLDNDGTEATTPWFIGPVKMPELNMTETDITITVKAFSNGILASKLIMTASFQNESMYDAILKLISPFNLEITFDEDDDETEDLLSNRTYSGISAEPPLVTVKNILLQADCYFTLITGEGKDSADQIRIRSRSSLNRSKFDYTFVLYRQIDPANNVIPIYSMNIQTNGALFLPGSVFGTSQNGVDSSTKEIVKKEISDKSNKTKSLSGTKAGVGQLPGASTSALGVSNGIGAVPPDVTLTGDSVPIAHNGTLSNMPEIEAKALIGADLGVTYQLTLPGLPGLRALRLAQIIIGDNIKGISGAGQIYSVTHKTGSDGWTSEIDFRKQPGLVDGVKNDRRDIENVNRPTAGTSKTPINISSIA